MILYILLLPSNEYSFYVDMEQYVLTNLIWEASKEKKLNAKSRYYGADIRQIDEYGFLVESIREWRDKEDNLTRDSKWFYNSRVTPLTYNGLGNKTVMNHKDYLEARLDIIKELPIYNPLQNVIEKYLYILYN